jgi:hypothetical protein
MLWTEIPKNRTKVASGDNCVLVNNESEAFLENGIAID